MKALSKQSQKVFNRVVEGLAKVGDNQKFDSGQGFMPLCVEVIGQPKPGQWIVSLAHYFEMNGDFVCDPDVTFLVAMDGAAYPMTFQQGIPPVYQVAMEYRDGSLCLNEKLQKEITSFCNTWLRNVREQQDI